jgi:hypothetical protein
VSRCKVYEVQGPDPSRTASARRCIREATDLAVVGRRVIAVCKQHERKPWELFEGKDSWVYAVDPTAATPSDNKKKKKGKSAKKAKK